MIEWPTAAAIALLAFFLGVITGRRGRSNSVVWTETPSTVARTRQRSGADPTQDDVVDALLRQKQKIQAIKRYRELTGAGLKDAKDAIDAREIELRRLDGGH